jgi:hypothetical protein
MTGDAQGKDSREFDEKLWEKEAGDFLETAREKCPDWDRKVYICEVFLNKMNLARLMLDLDNISLPKA